MKALLKHLMGFLLSLRAALWTLGLLALALLAGAFIMPLRQEEFQAIHSIPLFLWLQEQPLSITWWLWLSVGLLAVLTVNTIACSIESIIKKRRATQWLLLISPQIIHIGFLFILLAHLLSATGGAKGMAVAGEGSSFMLPGNAVLLIKNINIQTDPAGYIADWAVDVEYRTNGKTLKDVISPNSPSLQGGLNINVKDLRAFPEKAVLLQISRDPGAFWALMGGIFFMLGIVTLAILRIKTEKQPL